MSDAATLWGVGTYERIAALFAPIHDDLVDRLRPATGQRWLDVATGTGEVAFRAARAGAEVTGLDIAPWELFVSSFGPVKALAESLEPERREEFHRAFVDYYETEFREGDEIVQPREYLLTLGIRR